MESSLRALSRRFTGKLLGALLAALTLLGVGVSNLIPGSGGPTLFARWAFLLTGALTFVLSAGSVLLDLIRENQTLARKLAEQDEGFASAAAASLRELEFGATSSSTIGNQSKAAQASFNELAAAALAGDRSAVRVLPEVAHRHLGLWAKMYGTSTHAYVTEESRVIQILRGVEQNYQQRS